MARRSLTHRQSQCVAANGRLRRTQRGNPRACQAANRCGRQQPAAFGGPMAAPHSSPRCSRYRLCPMFLPTRAQVTHALKSLASMGVPELAVAYAAGLTRPFGKPQWHKLLASRTSRCKPSARAHAAGPQPIVLFVGGTPELHAFVEKLKLPAGRQCYVIALADVNLQVLAQMGNLPKKVSIVATQTVPWSLRACPSSAHTEKPWHVCTTSPLRPRGWPALLPPSTPPRSCNRSAAPSPGPMRWRPSSNASPSPWVAGLFPIKTRNARRPL